jgi:hypothetical protein
MTAALPSPAAPRIETRGAAPSPALRERDYGAFDLGLLCRTVGEARPSPVLSPLPQAELGLVGEGSGRRR